MTRPFGANDTEVGQSAGVDLTWHSFHADTDVDILINDIDDDIHWQDMMDTTDEHEDDDEVIGAHHHPERWMQPSNEDHQHHHVINDISDHHQGTISSMYKTPMHEESRKKKRSSLDPTETSWLSEDADEDNDEQLMDLVVGDMGHNINNNDDDHEMILADQFLELKEWSDHVHDEDDGTATIPPYVAVDSGCRNAETKITNLSSLILQQHQNNTGGIPSTITARKHSNNNNSHRTEDDDHSVNDAIMTMIMEGDDDCSLNAFLLQQQQQQSSSSSCCPNMNRRHSLASHGSTGTTVAGSCLSTNYNEVATSVSGTDVASIASGAGLHDLFEQRRAQLAMSMEASRRSRTLCFLKSHVKTRASLANVLRDIERSSRVVAHHIVKYWEEQNRLQSEQQHEQQNLQQVNEKGDDEEEAVIMKDKDDTKTTPVDVVTEQVQVEQEPSNNKSDLLPDALNLMKMEEESSTDATISTSMPENVKDATVIAAVKELQQQPIVSSV